MSQKLCFVLPNYDPNASSHYYHLHELISKLAQNQDIFFFAESGQRQVQIPNIDQYYVQRFKSLPLRIFERLAVLFWIYLSGYHRFYCHYADITTIFTSFFTRVFGGKTFKWHCVQEHFYEKPFNFKHLKEKLARELPLYLSFKAVQYIVTGSKEMKQYYQKYFHIKAKKIIVIPNSVNLGRFTPTALSKIKLKQKLKLSAKPTLLFVHHLSERKGADRLIGYAQTIKHIKLNLFILAIGKGPLLRSLRNKTHQFKLSHQITFTGAIPNHQLPQYYQASDVLIMPSRIEEFARVQLEAMASGLPIIATNTLATQSVLNRIQKQLVVKQIDHVKIPLKADHLIRSKRLYAKYVTNGYSQVKKFDLDKTVTLFSTKIIG